MRTLILFMALTFSMSICSAQEVFELTEARIITSSVSTSNRGHGKSLTLSIPETYAGEFERNPLNFLKENFDIHLAIAHLGIHDEYEVIFKSRKGQLVADYDRKGRLQFYTLKFKDVLMPYQLMVQLYRENQGWALISNTYEARGKGDSFDEGHYSLTMKNGKNKRILKYNSVPQNYNRLAVNYNRS